MKPPHRAGRRHRHHLRRSRWLESNSESVCESRPTTMTLPLYSFRRTGAVDGLLGVVDQRLQRQTLRAPPVAVVDQAGVARHQVVLEVGDFTVQGDGLDGAVGTQQDGAARGFVAAARTSCRRSGSRPCRGGRCRACRRCSLSLVSTCVGVMLVPLMATTSPLRVGPDRWYSAVFGAASGDTVQRHIDSSGSAPGSSRHAAFVGDVQQVGVHRVGRAALACACMSTGMPCFSA